MSVSRTANTKFNTTKGVKTIVSQLTKRKHLINAKVYNIRNTKSCYHTFSYNLDFI